MIEVKSGKSAQIPLKLLNTITVSNGVGTASVSFEGSLISNSHTGTKTYGPFKTAGKFAISAISGAVAYSINTLRNKASTDSTGVLGPVESLESLGQSFPAANNIGKEALVGTEAPYFRYVSNGLAWVDPSAGNTGGTLPVGAQSGEILSGVGGAPVWRPATTVVAEALTALGVNPGSGGSGGGGSNPSPGTGLTANNDTANGTEDTALSGNVLTNDTTESGTLAVTSYTIQTSTGAQTFTAGVSSTTNPLGTFILRADGTWNLTPRADQNGVQSAITYTVSNGTNQTTGTLTITLAAVNDAPVAGNDSGSGLSGSGVTINVLANDTDADGNTLSVTKVNGTAIVVDGSVAITNGTVRLNANKSLLVTSTAGYTGTLSFTYAVSDGTTESVGNVTVSISAVVGGGGTTNWITGTTTTVPFNWSANPVTKSTPVVEPTTGATIRRLTDVTQDLPGQVALYNAYSRYPNENVTGEYVLAFASNSSSCLVIDRSNGTVVTSLAYDNTGLATHTIGAAHEVRWHYTAAHPYRVYFVRGTKFWMINDVRDQANTRTMIKDFASVIDWGGTPDNERKIYMDQEGNSSLDSDDWAWMAAYYNGSVFVMRAVVHYKVSTDHVDILYPSGLTGFTFSPAGESAKTSFTHRPNMVEMAPDASGIVIHHQRAYSGTMDAYINSNMEAPYFWPADFNPSTFQPFRIASDASHSGWSTVNGVWHFVSQDNRRDKWIAVPISGSTKGYGNEGQIDVNQALSPAVIDFHTDGGIYPGMHFGVCTNAADGWTLVSTYSTSNINSNALANSLYMMKIVPEGVNSVKWLVAPSCNQFPAVDKQDYNEAPASINLAGTRVITCGDWGGTSGIMPSGPFAGQRYINMFEVALADNYGTHFVPAAPVNTAVPTISGTTTQGQTLTATPGTWTGFPTPTVTRVWQRNGTDIAGATGLTYLLQAADAGAVIRVKETAVNASGTVVAYSSSTAAITGLAVPVNTALPTISGTAQEGFTLTGTSGTWTNSPTGYAYQWLRGSTPISGATSSTYTIVNGDVGSAISLRVTASNALGAGTPVTSAATATVTLPTGTVSRISAVTSVDPSPSAEPSHSLPAFDAVAGNLIVVAVRYDQMGGSSISGVTDTAGNTYTAGTAYTTVSGGFPSVAQLWYCLSSKAKTGNVVTVTQVAGTNGNSSILDCSAIQYQASAGTWSLSSQTGVGSDYVPLPVATPSFNMGTNSVAVALYGNYYSNVLPITTGGATLVSTMESCGWVLDRITGNALTNQTFSSGDSQSGGYSRMAVAVGVFRAA